MHIYKIVISGYDRPWEHLASTWEHLVRSSDSDKGQGELLGDGA